MPAPLQGSSGTITFGGTALTWVGTWEVTLDNATQDIGPHIGDATIYEVNTSQKWTWKIDGDIISGGDTGINNLQAAATGRTTGAMVFDQNSGRKVTFSAATITKLGLKVDANGTQTISAEGGNGAGTVTLAAGS